MEELNKEDLERIKDVFSKYKDGFESGTLIKSVLLNIGEPNKNEDVFEMPTQAEIQIFKDDNNRVTARCEHNYIVFGPNGECDVR